MPDIRERRKFVRYRIPFGTLFVFDHLSTRVGWVRDVGRGGVAFECKQTAGTPIISEVIDIFSCSNELFYLAAIPCKRTFLMDLGKRSYMGDLFRANRFGQQFVELTDEQKTKWHGWINKQCPQTDAGPKILNSNLKV